MYNNKNIKEMKMGKRKRESNGSETGVPKMPQTPL